MARLRAPSRNGEVLAELAGRHGDRDALVEIWNGRPRFTSQSMR